MKIHTPLYGARAARELDRIAIEELGIPGEVLMERAGSAAFDVLRATWPAAERIGVVCGAGNNAGDGFVVARLACEAGLDPRVMAIDPSQAAIGDAARARHRMEDAGLAVQTFDADELGTVDVVVDALLGTGLTRAVAGSWAKAVSAINASRRPVLALDIPSGLSADSGAVLGCAVQATSTITFIGRKRGLYTGAGRAQCGSVSCADLAVPATVFGAVPADAELLTLEDFGAVLGPREQTAHKGANGHVLIVGGDHGFGGAARLAGEAAARVGAGLTSVVTRPEQVPVVTAERPELMCRGVTTAGEVEALLQRATVIAVGPGLGCKTWGRELCAAVLATDRPAVVDADALNLIAEGAVKPGKRGGENRIYTPHPGEAARLLGCSTAEIQSDRYAALDRLVARYGGIWVLKGAGTLVSGRLGAPGVCRYGNPGMATGGMGDALTGAIAGLLAQGLAPAVAAPLGVCLHSRAADLAATDGERGLLAGDLMGHLRALVNTV